MMGAFMAFGGIVFLTASWLGMAMAAAKLGHPSSMSWLPWWAFAALSLISTVVWSVMLWRGRK